jgi:hypothetical protein
VIWQSSLLHEVGKRRLEARAWCAAACLLLGCQSAMSKNSVAKGVAAKPETDQQGAPVYVVERLPEPMSAGDTNSSVVVLQSPSTEAPLYDAIHRFFDAVATESPDAMTRVLDPNAVAHFGSGAHTSVLGSWLRRFARADYRRLSADAVFSHEDVETLSATDARRLQGLKSLPLLPTGNEVLARLTIGEPDSTLLGSSMTFVLGPTDNGYRIRATYEELAP